MPDGAADGLRGHAGLARLCGNLARERAVGDAAEQFPHVLPERAPARSKGEFRYRGTFPSKVQREPRLCPYEERRLAFLYAFSIQVGRVVLPRDPEPDERPFALWEQDVPERRRVMRGINHPISARGIFLRVGMVQPRDRTRTGDEPTAFILSFSIA